jgi:signal transduction histidine kinase/CheY-like chemotaxis protein/HPt (histidine-containing phosphotransfer) domain-containing protein
MKSLVVTLGVILTLNVTQTLSFVLNVRSLAYNQILSNTAENALSLTDSISRQFKAWNSLAEDTAVGIVPFISGDAIDAAAAKKYLVAMAENKDDISALYVVSTASRAAGGYLVSNVFSHDDLPDDPLYDHTAWEYFIRAVEKPGTPAYFGPYFDLIGGDLMISLGYAVREKYEENGKTLCCVMIDVLLEQLVDIINKNTTIEYRETFLITKTGEFVSNRDAIRRQGLDTTYVEMKDFFAEKNLEAYREAVLEEGTFSHLGEDVFIYSAYIPAADWILVSVVPRKNIFADANDRIFKNGIASVLTVFVNIGLGLVIVCIIKRDRAKLVKMKDAAEAASRSKSDFLARMSHEIRTPLNAIIGMSELALQDGDTQPRTDSALPEYLATIRQAGSNLLSIINDILDVSKIESSSFQLAVIPYLFSSLIDNVVNVIRVRFHEKSILFLVNVDSHIPDNLLGDEVRIRQILFNLLSNAVKYTEEGFIKLTITAVFTGANNIVLKLEVADSGIGIKEEDMKDLFGNFTRLDLERNRAIEGTGLGLAITNLLCREMGGNIAVSSVYGKGSVFTVTLPQEYTVDEAMAKVENPDEKEAALYDERPSYADSVAATLENLGIAVTRAKSAEDFLTALETGSFPFAFISSGLAERAAALVRDKKKQTNLVLLADMEETFSFQGIPAILMPAYAVPVANLLNNVRVEQGGKKYPVRFTAPDVRVLIVDDITTNLKVAQGLLAAYRMQVDLCDNGASSIAMVKAHRYDLVFMDHMMPGMDGIEAMARIRRLEGEYFERLPVIALTANALSGMQEMFLSKGFNDYLAKPIEISKLNALIEKWVPKERRQAIGEAGALASAPSTKFEIEGLDTEKGIAMAGGSAAAYREILELYCQDAEERLPALDVPAPEDLRDFVVYVHGLKSASATIGADTLSTEALFLENAGKVQNWEYIAKHLPGFKESLSELVARIDAALRNEGK